MRDAHSYESEDVYHNQKTHTERQNCNESKGQNKGGHKGENQSGEDHVKNKIEGGFRYLKKDQKKKIEENQGEGDLTQQTEMITEINISFLKPIKQNCEIPNN